MKIALLIQNADRRNGGAEGYTLDLARALTSRGHQVTVMAEAGPAAVSEDALAHGFKCIYVGAAGRRRWTRLKDLMERFRDVYDRGAYEVVHAMLPVWRCDVYQPHAGLAMDLWMTGHMKYRRGLVRRWARRFNRWSPKRRGLAHIEQDLMRQQPRILCFSQAMRHFALEKFALPESRLVMLMNGIDLSRFEPEMGLKSREAIRGEWRIAPDQRLALLVGNNWKLKGVAEAIQALARQPDKRTVLMMVGRGEPETFRKLAEKLGVAERVLFGGSVPDPRPFYGAADYLLLPTRRDTCSLVVLEALAMGLPVVTTRQNGASDVIVDGRQGLIVEHGDEPALAGALGAMLDGARLKGMSQAALAMRGNLSFEHHVERIEKVYMEVLAERSGLRQMPSPGAA